MRKSHSLSHDKGMAPWFQIYPAQVLHILNFVNGVLLNMETRSYCTGNRIEMVKTIKQTLFRRILQACGETSTATILTGHWLCSNSIPAHDDDTPNLHCGNL